MTWEDQKFDYCKAWVDQRLFGVEQGKRELLVQLVCKKMQKDKPIETIADELEEEIGVIEKIVAVQQKVGSYDAEQISNAMADQGEISALFYEKKILDYYDAVN